VFGVKIAALALAHILVIQERLHGLHPNAATPRGKCDGVTTYLGQLSYSTIPSPAWSPVIGLQHQLDSAASGVTIEEYLDKESAPSW
jgi:hypothetical protein